MKFHCNSDFSKKFLIGRCVMLRSVDEVIYCRPTVPNHDFQLDSYSSKKYPVLREMYASQKHL